MFRSFRGLWCPLVSDEVVDSQAEQLSRGGHGGARVEESVKQLGEDHLRGGHCIRVPDGLVLDIT